MKKLGIVAVALVVVLLAGAVGLYLVSESRASHRRFNNNRQAVLAKCQQYVDVTTKDLETWKERDFAKFKEAIECGIEARGLLNYATATAWSR